jgi:hypothetical protein
MQPLRRGRRPVREVEDARAEGLRLDQLERRLAGAVLEQARPLPTTSGWIISLNSSITPSPRSERTRVALPLIAMSLPGCCFSFLISATTSSPSSVEFCQVTSLSVFEATYFGRPFMAAAIGSSSDDWLGQNAAHSS